MLHAYFFLFFKLMMFTIALQRSISIKYTIW